MRYRLRRQAEQLRRRYRRAEDAAGGGDVPSAGVMCRRYREADPARDLDAERQRQEYVPARCDVALGERQRGRGDGRSRMDDGREVGVVEVEEVARHGIGVGGVEDVEALRAPDQAGLARTGKRAEHADRRPDRGVSRRAERAADEVEERALCLVADRGREIVPRRRGDEGGERLARRSARRHRYAEAA